MQDAQRDAENETRWFAFADKLPPIGHAIFGEAEIPITEKGFGEPKILTLALLCRTLSNFRGVVALARLGLIVEARTLTRCGYENLFCIAGLLEKGDEFVTAMFHDELASIRSRGTFILENPERLSAVAEEFGDRLRNQLQDMKQRCPKARFLRPKDVAESTVIREGYVAYSKLSGDAAHPSISALKRHLVRSR